MSLASKLVRKAGDLGLYQFARLLTANTPRILMYHRFAAEAEPGYVSRERFREQVAYIKKYYHPMTLQDLSTCLFDTGKVPRYAIVITVDDGYRDFHDVAWPVLKELDVPATLFVTTGFVDGRLWLWPDQISWLFAQLEGPNTAFKYRDFELAEGEVGRNPGKTWQRVIDRLLSVPDAEKHEFIAALASTWQTPVPATPPPAYAPCSWDQLVDMQNQGIEIGGHTVTHPTLGQVSREQAVAEVAGCKAMLADNLPQNPRTFCYPNGMPSDFSTELMKVVEETGFDCAVAAFADNAAMKHRYALRRHSGAQDWFQFHKAVSGVEYLGQVFRGNAAEHR
ncbi:polysaccharide deacetylase family protein [Marinobacter flavimaris]|uniref:polysaccharide deacetylase family protein n=1 Tax=Marinobacter flavimaris TaxID=262076 RepID=UPI003863C8B8